MIPEAAVEAAAKRIYLDGPTGRRTCEAWEGMDDGAQSYYRLDARRILEAAAPHMLAEVNTRVEQVNLPNGTVILSEQGGVFQHFNGYWFEPGSSYRHHLDDITLPATVIHRPAP